MRVRYTLRARADLREIFAYLYELSPRGAIKNTVAQIGHERRRGQATDKADVRRVPVVRYPYAVYFRVSGDEAHIVHIRHTSRRVPKVGEL